MSGSLTDRHLEQTTQAGMVELAAIDMDDLTDVLHELRRCKVSEKALKDRIEILNERAIDLLEAHGQHNHLIDDPAGDGKKIAQVVVREDTVIDLDRLRELAGQSAVDAVVAPSRASVERWNHAVEHGLIPIDVAAHVCSYQARKPYISFVNAHD